jgi:uncharacterized protein with GYD domain
VGRTLAKYLWHGSYSVEGIHGVRQEGGTRRVEAIEALARSVGGSLESFYFGFGGDDFYIIVDLPDNVRAAAVDAAARTSVEYRAPGT